MWQYVYDKPDIRYGMKIMNLKSSFTLGGQLLATGELIKGAGFGVFDNAETVLAISVPGCSEYTRKQTDELTEWVKRPQIGMQGLVYIKYNADGSLKSSIDKFYSEDRLRAIAETAGGERRGLLLFFAPREEKKPKANTAKRAVEVPAPAPRYQHTIFFFCSFAFPSLSP